jgi:SAM-dependent methyltransferase
MHRKDTVRGRFNSGLLDLLESHMDRTYGPRKRSIFRNLPQQVVEIGPGPGANLRYYSPGTELLAVEPNPLMHSRLRKNAERYHIHLEIRAIGGEHLDLHGSSFPVVVGTLVLCTVEDPRRVISEVHRILTPGGRFIFLEHVAAPQGSHLHDLQNLLYRPWKAIFEGCRLNRNTPSLLRQAGFSQVDMDCFMLKPSFLPVTPHIFGQAVK